MYACLCLYINFNALYTILFSKVHSTWFIYNAQYMLYVSQCLYQRKSHQSTAQLWYMWC